MPHVGKMAHNDPPYEWTNMCEVRLLLEEHASWDAVVCVCSRALLKVLGVDEQGVQWARYNDFLLL